jgi:outer membrane protein assembly factor BamB
MAVLIVAFLLFIAIPAAAEDWPQFRGPTGQGHSTERGLPLDWSESKNITWKTPIPGSGWSSPVVAGGQVWLTSMTGPADPRRGRGALSLRALAFDVATGREALNVEVFRIDSPGPMHQKNSRASPTPILDGDRVYVHFGAEGTAALTIKGEILWKTRLPYESQHGNGGSPVLYRDLLIVNCDGNGGAAYVAAIDTIRRIPRRSSSGSAIAISSSPRARIARPRTIR